MTGQNIELSGLWMSNIAGGFIREQFMDFVCLDQLQQLSQLPRMEQILGRVVEEGIGNSSCCPPLN